MQRGNRRQHEALRPVFGSSALACSGSEAMSNCIRRMRRRSGRGAKSSRIVSAQEQNHRRATPEPAVGRVTSTRGRATQRGKRRLHEALRPSAWTSVLVSRGSDAMSDCMRRMRRRSSHGAQNEHSTGTAGSQTCNARASRRPCDVHKRACDAARQTPSARRFEAVCLQVSACAPWL